MPSWTDDLRFAYQPVVNLTTASVTALEILARPETGDVLADARRDPRTDVELAGLAVRAAARHEALLPLHVNVFAATVAALPGLPSLDRVVVAAGRRPWEITLDVGPPFGGVPRRGLVAAVAELRRRGYRICVDGVGDGDLPLRLLTRLAPDLVKLDATLVAGLPQDAGSRAAVAALRQLCDGFGALLAAEGVETERQCAAARGAGAQLAQGNLFAPPARRPAVDIHRPAVAAPPPAAAGPREPRIAQFVQPAALLPLSASAEHVRALLTGSPGISSVMLVDAGGVPRRAVHRDRFLLSLSGRYGHALYADRPAVKLADCPRTVPLDATAWEVLDVVAADERSRTGDDVAVVDGAGRCVGMVHLADIVRALAESRVEEAARLNPLTRLPGSDTVNAEVDRRIATGRAFALSWLDVDGFKQVNDGAGFAAGDELIRSVGRTLADAATGRRAARIGHIGGDDFLVLTDPDGPDGPEPIAAAVLDTAWSAGGLPVTLSLATVVCPPGSVTDHRQAAACLAPLKKSAKSLRGASWVLARPGAAGQEVRRGAGAARASGPGGESGPARAPGAGTGTGAGGGATASAQVARRGDGVAGAAQARA
ncbi:bifunctional diguanylate cyclase/phosphodiesterase [Streptomyces sp. XD-27]|uniref:bifunctional diguanylate cyclase/phosphodiesterase n=1 Tax=Streptomyces sp. XD-27 TaxID=3062779 RepID=UPI0026F443D9|nr:bifunctional diguanylate cyclase/phosphodiesterase [Streptomyces sp. XD-27]WKX73702.1 bifunctional diguanylate cyclase/phosphodiesterase [Streptomyces sp. XD-27]